VGLADDTDIAARYPIVWREPSGPTYAGSLVLGPDSMTMDGVVNGDRAVIEIPYDDLDRSRMATVGGERLGGRPTLVLHERSGRRFRIAAVGGTGVMGEVADVLARELTVA